MVPENTESAFGQIQEAGAAGLVVHESRLLRQLNEQDLERVGVIKGKSGTYYYDPGAVTERYARIMVSLDEQDYLVLAAETIRSDSKRYPRTTPLSLFAEAPFLFDPGTIEAILKKFTNDDGYNDIHQCAASNGAIHLYSTTYLVKAQAEYICEWNEVGRIENQ